VCDLFVPNQCRVFHNEPAIDPSAARTRKEYGMTSKWERRALLAGALAVPFWLAGIILVSTKAKGSEGPKILASYHQHSDGILLGGFLWSLGILLFIWFLGSLRSHYLAAEGGSGRLTALAYSGGVLAATLGLLIPGPDSAGALERSTSTPPVRPSCTTSPTRSSSAPSTCSRFSSSRAGFSRSATAPCRSGSAG
jgi:hypothetical protein